MKYRAKNAGSRNGSVQRHARADERSEIEHVNGTIGEVHVSW